MLAVLRWGKTTVYQPGDSAAAAGITAGFTRCTAGLQRAELEPATEASRLPADTAAPP